MFPGLKVQRQVAKLLHAATHHGAVLCEQPFFGHRTSSHHGRGQTRRRAPAATRVADAVFLEIGVVGMAGPKGLHDGAVIFAALVGVFDQQANRRAGRLAFKNARQNLDRIGLIALGDKAAGAGAAAIEIGLNVGLRQGQARRAAVYHAAYRWPMGFTKVGDCKKLSESIAAHEM